jgi:hypothetical protein
MAIKKATFIPKGMQRDNSASVFNTDYAYENKNIRIIAGEDNNSFSVTNEKGNQELYLLDKDGNEMTIEGTVIGYAVIDNYLILFTTTCDIDEDDVIIMPLGESSPTYDPNTADRIYKFSIKKLEISLMSGYTQDAYNAYGELLYVGNLNFRYYKPIETLPIYENEDILKIYWTDGFNQPRMINVAASEEARALWSDDSFNFVPKLSFDESFKVTKHYSGGYFNPGVIQYAYAYFNKYRQISNLVDVTSLYYISYKDRGAKENEVVCNSFELEISNPDPRFEYVRIYSIFRSGENIVPLVKKVIDLPVPKDRSSIICIDDGTIGESIDPEELYYIGGEQVLAESFTHKDGTLFLGNITLKRDRVIDKFPNNLIESLADKVYESHTKEIQVYPEGIDINNISDYNYLNQLQYPSKDIKYFKSDERYRLGIQFQHETGKWSEPIFIKDVDVKEIPTTTFDGKFIASEFKMPVDKAVLNILELFKYVRVRPLVVYPSIVERRIICQGVVCPTVYNFRNRHNKTAHAQSSWFVRPFSLDEYDPSHSKPDPSVVPDKDNLFRTNKLVVFKHRSYIPGNNNGRNSEIQCIYNPSGEGLLSYNSSLNIMDPDIAWDLDVENFISKHGHEFAVDQSIVTLRSPDIEYNKDIQNLDLQNANFRIIGRVPLAYTFSDIDVQTKTKPNKYNGTDYAYPIGFYKRIDNNNIPGSTFCSAPMWLDQPSSIKKNAQTYRAALSSFIIYPFQRTGSLNNQPGPDENNYTSAELKYKKLFNLKYSVETVFNNHENFWCPEKGSNQIIWNEESSKPIKIPNTKYTYKGIVEDIITCSRPVRYPWLNSTMSGYPIVTTGRKITTAKDTTDEIVFDIDPTTYDTLWKGDYKLFGSSYSGYPENSIEQNKEPYDFYTNSFVSASPVSMKYKSTPHAVISINKKFDNSDYVLPALKYSDGTSINNPIYVHPLNYNDGTYYHTSGETRAFWDKTLDMHIDSDTIEGNKTKWELESPAVLWLGEFYRDIDERTIFGGTSKEAIKNNEWNIAGEAISITEQDEIEVCWTTGDTYYQRYDHLNTYPFSIEEENGIIDIVSFMCETRVNIDGRTDRNRSQEANHALTPNNYNLFNSVYNQKDNFFTYRILDEDKFDLNSFPNTITWTKSKIFGEFVDTWTNITMVSTLDLKGNYGPIRALKTFNNEIISFQDTGIANILFNSRSQITTTEGVPIELVNTGKVDGKRYLSDSIGCVNKWSITNTPSGLYFIDNINRAIMKFNGRFDNLSDRLGFRQWAKLEFNDLDNWHPKRDLIYSTHYDRITNDVLFINGINCLGFSEPLGQFSSFYSYERVPFVANLEDRTVMIKDNKLWLHQEGEYNNFFGDYKDFYTTIVCNPNRELDKIFNTVEFRSDSFTRMGIHQPEDTFDLLTVWNEYQTGYQTLKFERNKPSTLKKKFRIWRADIPRNQGTRDRIRNPWAYIKLSKHPKDSNKTALHDIVVYYTE